MCVFRSGWVDFPLGGKSYRPLGLCSWTQKRMKPARAAVFQPYDEVPPPSHETNMQVGRRHRYA